MSFQLRALLDLHLNGDLSSLIEIFPGPCTFSGSDKRNPTSLQDELLPGWYGSDGSKPETNASLEALSNDFPERVDRIEPALEVLKQL